jgi:hypothetical protein
MLNLLCYQCPVCCVVVFWVVKLEEHQDVS